MTARSFPKRRQTKTAHPKEGLNRWKELGQRLIPPGEKSAIQVDPTGFIRTEEDPWEHQTKTRKFLPAAFDLASRSRGRETRKKVNQVNQKKKRRLENSEKGFKIPWDPLLLESMTSIEITQPLKLHLYHPLFRFFYIASRIFLLYNFYHGTILESFNETDMRFRRRRRWKMTILRDNLGDWRGRVGKYFGIIFRVPADWLAFLIEWSGILVFLFLKIKGER